MSVGVICGATLLASGTPLDCFGQTPGATATVDSIPIMPQSALDALKLTKAGIGEDIILRQLKRAAPVDLTADQIIFLKEGGVSQNVIKALIDGGAPEVLRNTESPEASKGSAGAEDILKSGDSVNSMKSRHSSVETARP